MEENRNEIQENKLKEMENKLVKSLKETEKANTKKEADYRKLQNYVERQEREDRKNNVVIRGMKEEEVVTRLVVENFLEKVLKERSKVKWVRPTKSKEVIVVGLQNREEKAKIWKNKYKLKGSNIFIDDDLTKEERIRQSEIRKAAKIERGKGHEVRVGYNRIQIDGKWSTWSEGAKDKNQKNDTTNFC